jgi:uncharacterized metal-binding protein/predicted Fe-Mo cluster-binding NifX family protein
MRIALPKFGSRVAPSFLHSDSMLLAQAVSGEVINLETRPTQNLTENERLKMLDDYAVTLLVCGGIDRELMTEIESHGIQVIHNVAGETEGVLKHVLLGDLRPGFGITYRPATSPEPEEPKEPASAEAAVDCIGCRTRVCLTGEKCPQYRTTARVATMGPWMRQTMEAAFDIAAEYERALCRIAELIYFSLGMKHKHLGLAFCSDLFPEAETVEQLLRRYFRVTSVCCRLGEVLEEEPAEAPGDARCNPFAMAQLLNEAGTDLNALLGLCVGTDVVFSRLSHAPTTTLFVRDRLLANNPVAAVHSKYVLEHVLKKT